MLCQDSAEPGPAPADYPLSARLASSGFRTMADLRNFGPLPPLLVARSVVRPDPCRWPCWCSPSWPRSLTKSNWGGCILFGHRCDLRRPRRRR
eukprot:4281460-Pleurochrysis_carterae.AAC.1